MNPITAIKYASIAVIVLVLAFGVYTVTGLRADLVSAQSSNELLKQSIEKQKLNIKELNSAIIFIKRSNVRLQKLTIKQDKRIKKLNNTFTIRANGTSRDFGAITRAKPYLINKLINKATIEVQRCFELLSGAKPMQGDSKYDCQQNNKFTSH